MQLGHFPVVFTGHLRDPVPTQFGQTPLVPFGQTLGIDGGLTVRRPPDSAEGSLRTFWLGARFAASAAGAAMISPASNSERKRIVPSPFGEHGRDDPRLFQRLDRGFLIACLRAGKPQAIETGFRSVGHDRIEPFEQIVDFADRRSLREPDEKLEAFAHCLLAAGV